jgi:hypothetical protein
MRLLAVGPKEQLRIAAAKDPMLETMSLIARRLNDRRMSPPTRLVHDDTLKAVPDFRLPGTPFVPKDPGTMV